MQLLLEKNSVNLLRRDPTIVRTVVHMLSGIARQECVCEDEHGRDHCVVFPSTSLYIAFSHGLTD